MFEVIVEFALKAGIGAGLAIRRLDREDQRHQGLGDKAPAIDAEMAALVGPPRNVFGTCITVLARSMHY